MIRLRPYQLAAVDAIERAFQDYDSTLVVMPTGTGKTEVYLEECVRRPGRALVMAHRDFLVRQPIDRLADRSFHDVAVEMGDDRVDESTLIGRAKIIFTSVQTMSRPGRLKRFSPDAFDLLVVDEAHHAVANTYRRVIDHFAQGGRLKRLGLTATPKRLDGLAMGKVFDSVAYEMPVHEAIDQGWLVPIRQLAIRVEGLDFSGVRSLGADFNEEDLERVLIEEKHLHAVAGPTVKEAGDVPSLAFCVTVAHARALAAVLNRYKPGSADWLSGVCSPDRRKEVLGRYAHREVQFLCSCALFTEGFDAPFTAAIVMARPTKSLAVYMQALGRGTRPVPRCLSGLEEATPADRRQAIAASGKPSMVVLDFVGNSGKHKIVTAHDVLGGKYSSEVRDYARKTAADEARPADLESSLERADAELTLERVMVERRRRITARAEYRAALVNPFGGGVDPGGDYRTQRRGERATAKQVAYLVRLGVRLATAEGYSKRQASAVIDDLATKRRALVG